MTPMEWPINAKPHSVFARALKSVPGRQGGPQAGLGTARLATGSGLTIPAARKTVNRMTTTLSRKGQIVVPRSIRTKLGLQPGTQFEISTDGGKVVLQPRALRKPARLKRDRKTGLPTFVVPAGTPEITPEFVRTVLADFP